MRQSSPSLDGALDDRLMELEVKLSFQAQTLDALHTTLVDKEHRIARLEDQVARLEKALRILAQRQGATNEEIAGAMDIDDPVPRSG